MGEAGLGGGGRTGGSEKVPDHKTGEGEELPVLVSVLSCEPGDVILCLWVSAYPFLTKANNTMLCPSLNTLLIREFFAETDVCDQRFVI